MPKPFIPMGYGLVAKTELLGTGNTAVRAYYQPSEQRFLFSVHYDTIEEESEERCVIMGPIERRHLKSLIQTLHDVIDMGNTPYFISEGI